MLTPQVAGARGVEHMKADPGRALSMLTPKTDLAQVEREYKKVVVEKSVDIRGSANKLPQMCWTVDWYPEHLPTESAQGNSMHYYLQHLADPLICADGGKWPPPDTSEVQKEDILVFSDQYGFCNEILQNAPPGRIGLKNVQGKPASAFDEKTIQKLVQLHPWDLIVIGLGIDPPASNSVEDVHAHQDALIFFMLTLIKTLADDSRFCKRLCVLTADCFAMEKEIHKEMGLSTIANAWLFGFMNTARVELPQIPHLYIDTEWALRSENSKYLAAEIFRHEGFGNNHVRILNRGRHVMRKKASTTFELGGDFQLPNDGVIGISGGNGALGLVMGGWILQKAKEQGGKKFKIQFLSRSMKVSEQNMGNWRKIEEAAAALGIVVEHAKCDVSKAESVDEYIKSVTPDLTGFIHSAGVLADAMISNQTMEKFNAVFEGKSRAACLIHDALERMQNPRLEFYWMFSSSSVYGNMGQLPYSSSNSWMDALARHRRALGKPAQAPQWGAWGEVGMAANMDDLQRKRMAASPFPYFLNIEGLHGLEQGLRTRWPYYEVTKANPDICFGMFNQNDASAQMNASNLWSDIFPPAPSDPQKNLYQTYTHTVRQQVHAQPGLFLEQLYPAEAQRREYEAEA